MTLHRRTFVLASATAGLPGPSRGDISPLVISSNGRLPVLLTVPHDGDEAVASVPVRTQGTTVRDIGTRPLAETLANLLEQRLQQRPRMVIARFSRQFVDANRAEHEALESPHALPVYRSYHAEVERHVAELRAAFPRGALLLDIHGQGQAPDTTFRGTRGGLTVQALLQRHGVDAIQGRTSLIGGLATRGHPVVPQVGALSLAEDRRFSGGYTVHTYGSHRPQGIDAIQMEFGRAQRSNPRFAEHLAEALTMFLTQYSYLNGSKMP